MSKKYAVNQDFMSVSTSYLAEDRHLARLHRPEYAITNTLNSKDLTIEKKITSLKALIGTKIELYTSWLLVVDNVPSISRVHVHLPESGNEQWIRGQFLITTQDCIYPFDEFFH